MSAFTPLNDLEKSLVDARENRISIEDFLGHLARSNLALPSAGHVEPDGSGFQPVVFDKDGTGLLAAFTDKTRAVQMSSIATHCATMNAAVLFQRMRPDHGLVINPGLDVGLELSPQAIALIVQAMKDQLAS